MRNQSAEDIKNPELKMAMRALNHSNTKTNLSRLAAALMDSHLLSPIQRETVLMEQKGPSTRIKFEDIENSEGDKFYMAFTDLGEYEKWNSDENHNEALIMTMEDFGNILIRQVNDLKGFVIDPYGENVCISKGLLLSLLKQREARMNAAKGN